MVNANTGSITELFKPGARCMTPVGNGELLLAKANAGIFVGSEGKVGPMLSS